MRSDLIAEPLDGENGVNGIAARNKVFRLQLLAGAGRKAHPKMRQAFVPGTGNTHLLRAIFSGKLSDGMKILRGSRGAEEFRGRLKSPGVVGASFDPDFTEAL